MHALALTQRDDVPMTAESRIIVEPAGLVITPDSYHHRRQHRDIADTVMTTYGYDPNNVIEIRLTEGNTEVDWINRDDDWTDDGPPIHTTRHQLPRR